MCAAMATGGDPRWSYHLAAMSCMAAVLGWRLLLTGNGVRVLAFSWMRQTLICVEERTAIPVWARRASRSMLERAVHGTGRSHDIPRESLAYTRASLAAVPICAAAGIYPALFHDMMIMLVACGIPPAIYLAPYVRMLAQARERAISTGSEAAFFLSYVHVMQTVGVGLYRSMEMLARSGNAFPAMRRDAVLVCRRVATGGTRNDSLAHYSRYHPVPIIRDFVAGYVAKQSSLGDIPGYTAEKARQAFAEYESSWKRYEKGAQEIFGGAMMFAVVLPMMIMLAAMLATAQTVHTLLLAGTILSPAVSCALLAVLGRAQPAAGGPPGPWPPAFLLGVAVGAASHVMGLEPGMAVSLTALAFAVSNAAATRRGLRRVRAADHLLPEFLRDMAEMSRAGRSVSGMMQDLARRYPGPFGEDLARVVGRMRSGEPLDRALAAARFPTPEARRAAFLLGVTYRTGGGTPAILDTMAEFSGRVLHIKRSVTKSLAPLCGIVYATPFITLGMAHMMLGMFAGGAAADAPGGDMPFSPISGPAAELYLEGMGTMAAAMSVPMGAVAAKMSSCTVRDTIPLAITSLCCVVALALVPWVVAGHG